MQNLVDKLRRKFVLLCACLPCAFLLDTRMSRPQIRGDVAQAAFIAGGPSARAGAHADSAHRLQRLALRLTGERCFAISSTRACLDFAAPAGASRSRARCDDADAGNLILPNNCFNSMQCARADHCDVSALVAIVETRSRSPKCCAYSFCFNA